MIWSLDCAFRILHSFGTGYVTCGLVHDQTCQICIPRFCIITLLNKDVTCFNRVRYCSVRKVMENSSLRLKSLVRKPFLCVGWVSWYLSLSVYLAPCTQRDTSQAQDAPKVVSVVLAAYRAVDLRLRMLPQSVPTSDTQGCFFSK